jgi:hypothetical protein
MIAKLKSTRCIFSTGIKVVTNAGGVNPMACMKMLQSVGTKLGVTDLKLALVTGDDLMNKKDAITKEQCPNPKTITSANAYLGYDRN